MTSNQLTVSAIRQQFESTSCIPSADTLYIKPKYAMPSKSESETVTLKKQPPKTRPKPKTSAVVAGDVVTSAGVSVNPSQSAAHHEGRSANDNCTATDDVSLPVNNQVTSTTNSSPIIDKETVSPDVSQRPDDSAQSRPKRLSRDEMDIVRVPVKQAVISRWSSASSLSHVNAPASDDVRQAINRAKQKRVLQRIVGMKLEGETLPQQTEVTLTSDCVYDPVSSVTSSSVASDIQPTIGSSDNTGMHADAPGTNHYESMSVAETYPLSDDLVQNATTEHSTASTNPSSEMLPSHESTESDRTETESASIGIKRHAEEQRSRRPVSLYPQDIEKLMSVDTDSWRSVISQICTPRGTPQQSPLTENTPTVKLISQSPVAASRKSYLLLTEFVGENFSFLDELDLGENTQQQRQGSDDDADMNQTVAETSTERCTPDSADETEQSAGVTRRNERPKSLLRRSIILPNGEIMEIIGNAFTFLDNYD